MGLSVAKNSAEKRPIATQEAFLCVFWGENEHVSGRKQCGVALVLSLVFVQLRLCVGKGEVTCTTKTSSGG